METKPYISYLFPGVYPLLLAIIVSFSSSSLASGADNYLTESYSDRACEILLKNYDSIGEIIKDLESGVTIKEAAEFRKKIGGMRTQVDHYIWAYGDKDKVDLWQEYRKLLSEGYRTLGDFKDVKVEAKARGNTIDKKKKKKLWRKVKKWIEAYKATSLELDFQEYFANPENETQFISGRKLPKNIWGVTDFVPNVSDADALIVQTLVIEHSLDMISQFDRFYRLRSIYHDGKDEEEFHDVRKAVREIYKLTYKVFPHYFPSKSKKFYNALEKLDFFSDSMGDIQDLIIGLRAKLSMAESKKLRRKIEVRWKKFRKEHPPAEFEKSLNIIIQEVRKMQNEIKRDLQ